jgi:hypothetical protein
MWQKIGTDWVFSQKVIVVQIMKVNFIIMQLTVSIIKRIIYIHIDDLMLKGLGHKNDFTRLLALV